MRIVVAMDSFKGSLTAVEACDLVVEGVRRARPDLEVVSRPMADGGEGTATTLAAAARGEWRARRVCGPLPGTEVDAGFVWLPGAGPGALVEMASASGLTLLAPDDRDPRATTTYGTGQLLKAAADEKPARLWLAVGGSATVDGGMGAASALGWRFLDRTGADVPPVGGSLHMVERIEPPSERTPLPVEVLCDVDNPLLGERGAARVFGPQKGAGPDAVKRLEEGLAHLAERIRIDLGVSVGSLPGGGAAGGLAAGAVAFLGADLRSGVEVVAEVVGLAGALDGADWVVTGEGRFDRQSLDGKVVSGVARVAGAAGARVAVIAGTVATDLEHPPWLAHIEATAPEGETLERAMARSSELLAAAAARLAERL